MFYGWRIVFVVFFTNFVSVGLVFYSYGVFFKALAADFGGSRLGVATGLAIMSVVIAVISPPLGRLVDRGSIRNILCGGAGLLALGFVLASQISALWQFYVLMGTLVAVGSAMLGALAGSALITNWFSERRGTALGISGMGISGSGMIMALVATVLVGAIGWRGTFLVYAVASIVVIVPVVWLVVVDRPENMGLLPDGAEPSTADPVDGAAGVVPITPHWSAIETLRDVNFWVISLVVGLNFCANGAVLTHIIPHATDIGFEPMAAASVLSTMAGCGVVGKLVFGWVADRIPKRVALWIATGLQGLGVWLILDVQSYAALLLAGTIFGLGMGGMMPLWAALIGAGFGRHAFGRVMGLMGPVMLPVHIVGIPYAGWIYDRNGSYDVAFLTLTGAYVVAMVALLLLRLPDVEPGTELSASGSDPPVATIAPDAP